MGTSVMMLFCEFALLWFLGAKVSAPWWYWLVYAVMVAMILVPLGQGFIIGFRRGAEEDDTDGDD